MSTDDVQSGARTRATAVLHLMCGKAASGKSTLTRELAAGAACVVVSEDAWLSQLYPGEIRTLEDYIRCARRVKQVLSTYIPQLLSAGVSVILDFPLNTVNSRAWARTLAEGIDTDLVLHYLDVSDEVCKQRLKLRNASGEHPFNTNEEQFDQITRYFVPPTQEEGFRIVRRYAID
ncbi:ATP-binding protein [Trinickia sp. NRRL B-1857]|uniref:AAA family ATPase n=1 Tax=Trinickia sp. NRRL B-1857 TaxID=3162879 RepID=UPI003D27E900